MAKKQKWPQKKMGEHTGYYLHEDGSISPAPMRGDRLADLLIEKAAIQGMLNEMSSHVSTLLERKGKLIHEQWRMIFEDYGIEGHWSFNWEQKRLIPPAEEEPES